MAMLPRSKTAVLNSLGWGSPCWWRPALRRPITGRRQLLFSSEGSETQMGYQAFDQIKRQYKLSQDPEANTLVQQSSRRITDRGPTPGLPLGVFGLRR